MIYLDLQPGPLDLGLNSVVEQTVFVVADHLQVVGQRQAPVVDLVDLVAMDCLVGQRDSDLDLDPEVQQPAPLVLAGLQVPLALVALVGLVQGY